MTDARFTLPLNDKILTDTPRAAASLVLLRDGEAGLEVFLLRRHTASDVLGGAYVFPGGKLDAADAAPELAAHLDQPAAALQASLNEPELDPSTGAGLYVAALREAFEECGVLYATPSDTSDAAPMARLLRKGHSFHAALAQLGLRLQTRQLAPWSRWITPRQPAVGHKRFDTRFFVAAMPAGQQARHDDHETTDSVWLAPREALRQYWDGRMALAPPQIMSLAHLARHERVEAVLAAARRRPPPQILPHPMRQDEARLLCFPGDPDHPVRERALPGPTRLHVRPSGRFEPTGGFEGLFA